MRRTVRRGTGAILIALIVVGGSLGFLPLASASRPSSAPLPLSRTGALSNGNSAPSAGRGFLPSTPSTRPGLPAPAPPLRATPSPGATAALLASIRTAGVPLRDAFLPDLN